MVRKGDNAKKDPNLGSETETLMLMNCNKVPIHDYRYHDGETVGEFTGVVEVVGDMQQIIPATGTAAFKDSADANRIKLHELRSDLRADMKSVRCLYLE